MRSDAGGVDVAGYLNGGPIELISKDGNRVVWGAPVDEWTPGEPTVVEKVERLKQLIATSGAIDGGLPRIEIHRTYVEIDQRGRAPDGGESD